MTRLRDAFLIAKRREPGLLIDLMLTCLVTILFLFVFCGKYYLKMTLGTPWLRGMFSLWYYAASVVLSVVIPIVLIYDFVRAFSDIEPLPVQNSFHSWICSRIPNGQCRFSNKISSHSEDYEHFTSNREITAYRVRKLAGVTLVLIVITISLLVGLLLPIVNLGLELILALLAVFTLTFHFLTEFWPHQRKYRMWKRVWIMYCDFVRRVGECSRTAAEPPKWLEIGALLERNKLRIDSLVHSYNDPHFIELSQAITDFEREETPDPHALVRLHDVDFVLAAPDLVLDLVGLENMKKEDWLETEKEVIEKRKYLLGLPNLAMPRHYGKIVGSVAAGIALLQLLTSII